MNQFQGLSNKKKAKLYKDNYKKWKEYSLNENGFFIIFSGFVEENKLKKISGNALKLYIYLGMYSKNMTGEVWHSTKTIANYFGKSERTIRGWMKELEDQHLIKRMRLEFDGQPHVFLQPYNAGNSRL
ncbi:helix-turn-helix domain-containing protein [Bacillus cereus]|uniref:helix-turn-helix domain-containing protein n=1 Tax=Bacillus cereus TaxID=1396 RepID=UPI0021D64DC4|nr:helix-turn-helix domain-containing protein [Bacillus cereus]MCU7757198.1 helix-turn-helix domain-containing protein [Bacillus cereus]MDC7753029.1 helix-turn-helix domain-containing protein [Bacillus cereus]